MVWLDGEGRVRPLPDSGGVCADTLPVDKQRTNSFAGIASACPAAGEAGGTVAASRVDAEAVAIVVVVDRCGSGGCSTPLRGRAYV